MTPKVIYKSPDSVWRIVEIEDQCFSLDFLKGDGFKPETNPSLTIEQLRKEEWIFEQKVENEGVFGYALEKWNPMPDRGWEIVDSCFGFVGCHEVENHYIVDELKRQIV